MLQRYMHKEHLYPCQPAKDRVMMIGVAQAVAHYSVSLDGALFDDGLSIIFTATIGG